MAIVNPTSPTFLQQIAPIVVANGSSNALSTLDLRTSFGAWAIGRIGRRVATALNRSGYISIRRTKNDSIVIPNTFFDMLSSTVAASSNTIASGGAAGTDTVTLTSASSFAIGDTICLHSDDSLANRVEWSRIVSISSNTLTVERAFRISHNAADRVTTQGDVYTYWLPGGDIYEFRAINNSNQDLLFALDIVQYISDTVS
jgi:hypothetical protein